MSKADPALTAASEQVLRAAAEKSLRPSIAGFFDEATYTVTYVVHDPVTCEAAVIDSVLDYEAASGRTSYGSAERVIEYVTSNNLKVKWHIETHAQGNRAGAGSVRQTVQRRHRFRA